MIFNDCTKLTVNKARILMMILEFLAAESKLDRYKFIVCSNGN